MKKNSGFSLVELVLVLTAIVLLTVFVFYQFNRYQTHKSAAEEMQNLVMAGAEIRALYNSQNFSSLNTATVAKAKFFPKKMTNINDTITNKFGGNVVIGYKTDYTSSGVIEGDGTYVQNARYFAIEYDVIPSDVCIKITGGVGGNYPAIQINDELVKSTFSGSSIMDLDEAQVVSLCNSNRFVKMLFIGS